LHIKALHQPIKERIFISYKQIYQPRILDLDFCLLTIMDVCDHQHFRLLLSLL